MKNLIIISLCILFSGCAITFKENDSFDKNIFMRKNDSNSNFTSIGKINDKELIGFTNDYAKGAYKISGLLLSSNNAILEVLDDTKFNVYKTQILKEKDEQNRKKIEEDSKKFELNRLNQQNALERRRLEEQRLKQDRIDAAAKNEEEKKQRLRLRDQCLNSGQIGLCQVSNANNVQFVCGSNAFSALKYVNNLDCYVVDEYNISSKMEVKNNTSKIIKDVVFNCQQLAKSGTVLVANNQTIFDVWNPNEIKTISLKFLKRQQVQSLNCQVVSWK